MSEWNLEDGEWRDSNPLGKRIEDFVLRYSERVIYLRKDQRFKCPEHWSDSTETVSTFDTSCECWGFGHKISASIAPVRFSRGRNAQISMGGGDIRDVPGYTDNYKDVAHFPRGVYPKLNDILLACEWNVPVQKVHLVPNARPIRIHSIYMIKEINAHFQREVSWFSAGLEGFEIDLDHMNDLLIEKLSDLSSLDVTQTWQQASYW